jgi:hypothetical protein
VKTVAATTTGVSRRIARAGKHDWRVVGFDGAGAKVVAAARSFTVARRG